MKSYLLGLTVAVAGAMLAQCLNLPIPYLLGSLLATAALGFSGAKVKTLPVARQMGLTVIGASLGLYFTPAIWQVIVQNGFYLFINMIFALVVGFLGCAVLYRFAKVDFATAWFASAVGGASEMANLAEQNGARTDQVVAAHSLRVLMVVTIVPFFYQFMAYRGTDDAVLILNQAVDFFGLICLFLWCYVLGRFFAWRKWSNPWTFGPLLATAILAGLEWHWSAIPKEISQVGQLLIGWSLGSKFGRDFFQTAPRLLAWTAVNTVIGLGLTAGISVILVQYSHVALPTLGLGLTIGGVAEMTITAKVLQLGVPLVTAFHVSRMIAVVGSCGYLYQRVARRFRQPENHFNQFN